MTHKFSTPFSNKNGSRHELTTTKYFGFFCFYVHHARLFGFKSDMAFTNVQWIYWEQIRACLPSWERRFIARIAARCGWNIRR